MKALIITGPTASGKTDLVYRIAQKIPSLVINADSRQVYQGLDIIPGKDLPAGSSFVKEEFTVRFPQFLLGHYPIPHSRIYLLDLITPEQSLSVYDFSILSGEVLKLAREKNLLPIFVGGSMFYIRSLTEEVETLSIPPHITFRKKLAEKTPAYLREYLAHLNKERLACMNESDKQNPRRLVRAIEVEEWKKRHATPSPYVPPLADYDVLKIGLFAPIDYLRDRIDARVHKRIEQGALLEAEKAFSLYRELSVGVKTTNGYKELFDYCNGTVTLDEAVKNWKQAEYNNAKKQLTWMKKESLLHLVDIRSKDYPHQVWKRINTWYTSE